MKQITKIFAQITIFIFILSFAFTAYAADNSSYCSNTNDYSNSGEIWPLIQCGSAGQHCCDFTEAAILVNRIITWVIRMSVTVAAISFSIAGGKMLLNPESDSERQAAKDMFKKTLMGLMIILGAWLVVNTVISTLVSDKIDALRFLKQIN